MASTSIPVLIYSPRLISSSMTISAPVFTLPIAKHARTSSSIVLSENFSVSPLPVLKKSPRKVLPPIFSRAFRSSGWKITTSATRPTLKSFSASHSMVSIWNNAATSTNNSMIIRPLNRFHALVVFIHKSI